MYASSPSPLTALRRLQGGGGGAAGALHLRSIRAHVLVNLGVLRVPYDQAVCILVCTYLCVREKRERRRFPPKWERSPTLETACLVN